MLQTTSKDIDIGPCPTGERTVHPNNLPCLYAHCHLIPESRAVELVAPPSFPEWFMLPDPKVCSVNSNKANLSSSIEEATFPYNLAKKWVGETLSRE